MLQLVLGTAGTGKTGLVLARMKARAAAGKKSVLLVPAVFVFGRKHGVRRAGRQPWRARRGVQL